MLANNMVLAGLVLFYIKCIAIYEASHKPYTIRHSLLLPFPTESKILVISVSDI